MSVWEVLGELDRSQPRVGEQLICALREAIEQGKLPPGTRLPSTRDLAADLQVSRGLVVGAYARLIEEGRLAARRGSGTIVTAYIDQDLAESTVGECGSADMSFTPLYPGVPDLSVFPRTAWKRAYERALTFAADTDFDYTDPAGAFRLRAELAAYLGRVRAARVDVDRLVITSGATQALALLAALMRSSGVARMGVEDPGGQAVSRCFSWYGVEPVPIPVDHEGIDVDALRRSGLTAVLVTPAHQYPTGVVLAPRRRSALVEWIRQVDGVIVEDDYDAELRYDREPVGCLQGLASEHVFLIGSTSKTLAPALRLGWIVAPRHWRERLRSSKQTADGGGPTIEQLAFAELLAASSYDSHVRRIRRSLRERREALITQVREHLPFVRISGIAAGLHLTVEFPPDLNDVVIAERARVVGLGPVALSTLCMGGDRRVRSFYTSGLVMGYAAHPSHETARAIRLLAHIISM